MPKVPWMAELVQGLIALALIAAYVVLTLAGKGTDHLDLGIVAVLGVFFGGKGSQSMVAELKDILRQIIPAATPTPSTDKPTPDKPTG